jgi:5'-3' exonuclease
MKTRLLIDADSIIFASAVSSDDREAAWDKSVFKFGEVDRIVSETTDVLVIYMCHGGRNNWRKRFCKIYKENRTAPVPEYLDELHDRVEQVYSGYRARGEETDDLVVNFWKHFKAKYPEDDIVIAAIDKDFHQIPAKFYNFNKKEFYEIGEVESIREFYTQMIVGDQADNIKTCPKKGKAFAKKLFADCTSKYSFVRATFEVYKELYKGKAKNKYIHTYHLLKLGKRDDNFYLKF